MATMRLAEPGVKANRDRLCYRSSGGDTAPSASKADTGTARSTKTRTHARRARDAVFLVS